MNESPSTLATAPRDETLREARQGAHLTAIVLALLGTGFTAAVLIDATAPTPEPRAPAPAVSAAVDIPVVSTVESPEVASAVRQWVWETPAPERKPGGRYDFEELWLAR
jgi:hypothetical protein